MAGEGAQAAKAIAKKAAAPKPQSDTVQQAKAVAKKVAAPKPQSDTVQQAKQESAKVKATNKLAADYLEAQASPGYKGVGSNFYTPPSVNVKPKTSTDNNGGGGGGGGPEPVVSTPVETVVGSSGLVNGVNYKEEYLAEIRRLVLSLVKTSKSLLLRYNFSGIDRVPEGYLDADREAKSEALSSSFSRPESPFTLEEADLQDKFSIDLNQINNLISDLSNSAEKSKYFGSMRGGTFLPKEVKLLANGSVGYDMRLEFTSISNQDFIIKCYEVS